MRSKKLKLQSAFWIALFFGVSFSYLVWLLWQKLTTFIGNGNIVLIILGVIVLAGIFLGKLSFGALAKRFM